MTEYTSVVEDVTAQDGTVFGIFSGTPENIVKLRGDALMTMRQIAQEKESEVLSFLQTRSGVSAEYAMTAAIQHSRKPDVKADLLTVVVNENIAEGHRDLAISALALANAFELPLGEKYGQQFVTGLYGAAMREGKLQEAWNIAVTVKREGAKITQNDWPHSPEWDARERSAFESYTERVLGEATPEKNIWDDSVWDLRIIFYAMLYRDDGLTADNPSELSRKVADRLIQTEFSNGNKQLALDLAAFANMPKEYINKLGGQAELKGVEKLLGRLESARDKVLGLLKKD